MPPPSCDSTTSAAPAGPTDSAQAWSAAMHPIDPVGEPPPPRVRAVIGRGRSSGVEEDGPTSGPSASESIRLDPPSTWSGIKGRPTIHPSAFVDRTATVSGEVTVSKNVYIGPGVSARAGMETPFFIGPDSSLQDGVTLQALKGKVVMVQGRRYAIHIGRDVCVTHDAPRLWALLHR